MLKGRRLRPIRQALGFSMLELIVVTLVMSILAAIAIPKISQSISIRRLNAAAMRLAADLSYARSAAKNQGKSVQVQFTVADATYVMPTVRSPNGDSTYLVDLRVTPYPVGIQAADFGGDATVIFDLYGHADSDGTITINDAGNTKTLNLSQYSGKVTIQP